MTDKYISRDEFVGLIGERVNDDAWAERSMAEVERAAAERAIAEMSERFPDNEHDVGVKPAAVRKWLRARAETYRREETE